MVALKGRTMTLLMASAVALPSVAAAQTTPPTREEIERPETAPLPRDGAPRVDVEAGGVERAPCPLADPRYAAINVTISDVQFANLGPVSPESLRPAWADYAGRAVPVATVCEIRDRAATLLRRQGYLAAVQVPPQRIETDGVVRFDVLMARLVRLQVRGDAGRAEGVIARQLQPLLDQPVFNVNDAERSLLLVQDIPGYDVRLALRPAGTVPGEVIGEITVDYTPVEIDVNVQNFGSRSVGRFGGLLRAQFNGLLGMGDVTSLGYFATADFDEQHVVQASHALRIGGDSFTLGGDFTYAWTHPGIAAAGALKSTTLIATLRGAYPLVRKQNRNLLASGGLDLIDQEVRFAGVPLSRDKLRVVFARLDYDAIDRASATSVAGYSAAEPRWRIGGSIEARQGLSMLGASDACGPGFVNCAPPNVSLSKVEADPSAFVLRASGFAEVRPSPGIAFSLAPRAQWASGPLLSFEEFSAGNYTVGRGYDPGAIVGDKGAGFSAEVKIGSLVPRGPNAIALQPFGFFDAAWVWNEDVLFPPYLRDPAKLYSAGGGVRAAWGNHARLEAFAAAPLRRAGTQTDKGDVRLLVSLTVKLLPWSR